MPACGRRTGWRIRPPRGSAPLHDADRPAGLRAAWLTGALIGMEAAAAGIDVVCAPVLDLAVARRQLRSIGDRAYSADPAGGRGHGRRRSPPGCSPRACSRWASTAPATVAPPVDSHAGAAAHWTRSETDDLRRLPGCAHLPWMMTAHIVYAARRPGGARPPCPPIIDGTVIRGRLGFEGVLVSDDLAMGALRGPAGERCGAALDAGLRPGHALLRRDWRTRRRCWRLPGATDATLNRMRGALFLAERSRQALDPSALLAEREALLS